MISVSGISLAPVKIMSNKEKEDSFATNDESKQATDPENLEKGDYGYGEFPERDKKKRRGFWSGVSEDTSAYEGVKCQMRVKKCFNENPFVMLLVDAMKSKGCDIDPMRHISCEECTEKVSGGFDPVVNQTVICQNNSTSLAPTCGVLAHEFIHMFDYCRAKLDFTNLEHVACTEIRAATITHCSFISSMIDGDASPFNVKQRHQDCVKRKASLSVYMARKVSMDEAVSVVERVFDKCYKDREPFGRIPRRKSMDPIRILDEAARFGYTKDSKG